MQISIIPVTPFRQNCSLIWCELTDAAAIVDPGGDIETILAEVATQDVHVRQIMLTHGHLDHAGATAALAARLGVPIIGPHRADAFLIEALTEQGDRYGLEDVATFVPDRWLEDGDVVELGKLRFEVLHCARDTRPGTWCFSSATRVMRWWAMSCSKAVSAAAICLAAATIS
jgi:glyoxylase-like metal-dependent hydrolase (beta-lactamase superfamily II)